MAEGADSGVIPPWQWLSEHVLVPNLIVFGWTVLILEFLLSASFVSGRFTRIAANAGFAQSLVIGMSVANADGEWYWSYALMALLHVAVFATATRVRTGEVDRRIVALGLAGYAVVLGIANARNYLAPSDFTRDFVLFGGPTDFPSDFGRNLFAGSWRWPSCWSPSLRRRGSSAAAQPAASSGSSASHSASSVCWPTEPTATCSPPVRRRWRSSPASASG